jgi:hypothetical protein
MHRLSALLLALLVLPISTLRVEATGFLFGAAMQSASGARNVPLPLVQAIAYVNCRWEVISQPALNGGVGPMNILPTRLDQAAGLSGHSRAEIVGDPAANLDAGAALLAALHTAGTDLASWQAAVASTYGTWVSAEVFDTLARGETRTTTRGESITLSPQPVPATATKAAPAVGGGATGGTAAAVTASADYPPAAWVPASPANYSVANRPRDYPVDMVIIHDTEGSYGSAIQEFQNPAAQSSAHYVVSDLGQITQMVAEHDIAWHAGNWDYNTRAIGIEHEGYAYTPGFYTDAMYKASAQLTGSICSRWGVPMNRQHVIGHSEVPDPNNPGRFGGAGHHTDPGPYWDWGYYMSLAVGYALSLPSPPHMVVRATAVGGDASARVAWQPARSCYAPIAGYTVVEQPGNITQQLPASASATTFTGLTNGTNYTFTVTATNSYGHDAITSNSITAGTPWISQESLGGPVTSGPAVSSWGTNEMDVFYRGTDFQLMHRHTSGSGWSSEPLGGALTSAPAAVSWAPNRTDVFVRGNDNQLYHKWWDGARWNGWEPLGGVLTSAPTVASWSANRLDVFVKGTDQQLWHKWWDGAAWSGWQPLGGVLTSTPSATAWDVNRLDVFVRGTDQQIWHQWWYGTAWSGWQPLGGTLASAPAATSSTPNRLQVFTLTQSGSVQELTWDGSTWSGWQDLGGGHWLLDPAVIARQAGSIDVFAQGTDSALWHMVLPSP